MGMFGALGSAIKGGMKPNLVKKILPGQGGNSGQKMGGATQVNTGGMKPPPIGPSPNGLGQIGQAMANKFGNGMGQKPPMPMPMKPMPPMDMPPMEPQMGPFGPESGMNINPPAPNPMMGPQQSMGPSPQGMQELLAKMRMRNTGIRNPMQGGGMPPPPGTYY